MLILIWKSSGVSHFPRADIFTHKGRVDPWKTISQNSPIQAYRDIKQLDLSQYDLVLNDFEPITAWAAKQQRIKSISISHQAAFQYHVPQSGKGLTDRLIMKYFAPCEISLGCIGIILVRLSFRHLSVKSPSLDRIVNRLLCICRLKILPR